MEDLGLRLLQAIEALTAEVRGMRCDLAERLPPRTGRQRAASARERRKQVESNAPAALHVTHATEEKVTDPVRYAERTSTPPPPVPPPSPSGPTSPSPFIPLPLETAMSGKPDAVLVFEEWQRVCDKPSAKFTPERRRKVDARLKAGYSAERLFAAIRGCKASPHHQGQNDTGAKYEDLELICRDGKHVEMFEQFAKQPPDRGKRPGAAMLQISPAAKADHAIPGRKFL